MRPACAVPMAIVDIGGRTTDYVVVKDQAIIHGSSGSLAVRHVGCETAGGQSASRNASTWRPWVNN